MTATELEIMFWHFLPHFIAAMIGAIIVLLISKRKKTTAPLSCPLPSQVILEELETLLTEAFEKLDKDPFLRRAAELYDTKRSMAKK